MKDTFLTLHSYLSEMTHHLLYLAFRGSLGAIVIVNVDLVPAILLHRRRRSRLKNFGYALLKPEMRTKDTN